MQLPPLTSALPVPSFISAEQQQRDALALASRSKANTGRAIRHATTVLNASGQHVPTMTGEPLVNSRQKVRGISDQPAVIYAHTGMRVEEASWSRVFSAASDLDPARYQTTQRASYDRDVGQREDARLAGGHRLGSDSAVAPDYWHMLGNGAPQPTFQLAAHDRIILEGTTSTYPLHPYHPQQIARRARSAQVAASRAAQPRQPAATAGGSVHTSRSLQPLSGTSSSSNSARSHRGVSGETSTTWCTSLSAASREWQERQASTIAAAALAKTRSAPSSSSSSPSTIAYGAPRTRFQQHMLTTTGRL